MPEPCQTTLAEGKPSIGSRSIATSVIAGRVAMKHCDSCGPMKSYEYY